MKNVHIFVWTAVTVVVLYSLEGLAMAPYPYYKRNNTVSGGGPFHPSQTTTISMTRGMTLTTATFSSTVIATITSNTAQPTQSNSIFPINGYREVLPTAGTPKQFGLNTTWKEDHELGSMGLSLRPGTYSAYYGLFKCQFFCNAEPGCVSFYGQFVNVQYTSSSFQCYRFNDLLNAKLYVKTSDQSQLHVAGYNKISLGSPS